jgi:hypothetical protein
MVIIGNIASLTENLLYTPQVQIRQYNVRLDSLSSEGVDNRG